MEAETGGGARDLQESLQEAVRLSEDGDWGEAFQVLSEAERKHPTDATLLCMLGVTAEAADAGGLAYEYFRRCLAEQPTSPEVLVPLGAGLARFDDADAEGVLRLAALSAPGMAAARLEYGAYLAREGLAEMAIEELSEARRLDADDPRIGREMAVALALTGRSGEVADELERAASLADEDGELLLLQGLAQIQAGREEEGAEALYRAAEALPQDGEAQLAAALACATQEWWDQAWDALARADLAAAPPPADLSREVEEALEAGELTARRLLEEQLAPSVLRERLLQRE